MEVSFRAYCSDPQLSLRLVPNGPSEAHFDCPHLPHLLEQSASSEVSLKTFAILEESLASVE